MQYFIAKINLLTFIFKLFYRIFLKGGEIKWNDLNLENNYNPIQAYKQSKLCNILFTNYLEQIYLRKDSKLSRINAYSISPGIVLTNLGRYILNESILKQIVFILFYPIIWYIFKRPRQGAESIIYCAIESNSNLNAIESIVNKKLYYFRDCKQIELKSHACNEQDAKRLWDMSENFVKEWLTN